MIARVRLALPFYLTIPENEELDAIEYEEQGYSIKVYPPYQANITQNELQFTSPGSMQAILEKLSPVSPPVPMTSVKIGGKPAYQANALQLDFKKDTYDRAKEHAQNNYDPAPDYILKVANNFLSKIRSVTTGFDMRPLGKNNTIWQLEYLSDSEEPLPTDPNLFRKVFLYSGQWRMTLLNEAIMEKVTTLSQNYEMKTWETLILDAEALLPDVRASIVLAFSALETLITIALDDFVKTTPVPAELWKWITERDFFLKEPSVKEKYTILLKILKGKSLQDETVLWQAFSDLNKVRNKIAHTGKPVLDGTVIDAEKAGQLIASAKQIISWIESLMPENNRRPLHVSTTEFEIIKPITD